jgi:hypothetical protein
MVLLVDEGTFLGGTACFGRPQGWSRVLARIGPPRLHRGGPIRRSSRTPQSRRRASVARAPCRSRRAPILGQLRRPRRESGAPSSCWSRVSITAGVALDAVSAVLGRLPDAAGQSEGRSSAARSAELQSRVAGGDDSIAGVSWPARPVSVGTCPTTGPICGGEVWDAYRFGSRILGLRQIERPVLWASSSYPPS